MRGRNKLSLFFMFRSGPRCQGRSPPSTRVLDEPGAQIRSSKTSLVPIPTHRADLAPPETPETSET